MVSNDHGTGEAAQAEFRCILGQEHNGNTFLDG